jgi:hypothetical protein
MLPKICFLWPTHREGSRQIIAGTVGVVAKGEWPSKCVECRTGQWAALTFALSQSTSAIVPESGVCGCLPLPAQAKQTQSGKAGGEERKGEGERDRRRAKATF